MAGAEGPVATYFYTPLFWYCSENTLTGDLAIVQPCRMSGSKRLSLAVSSSQYGSFREYSLAKIA